MGSGASTIAELPEELKTLYDSLESLRNDIAILDARFINKQATQVWKNHKLIIDDLASRTKAHLQRVAHLYQKSTDEGGYNNPLEKDIREMLGGSYGDLMRLLVISRGDMDAELLRSALFALGVDENLLGDVLCTSSNSDIQNFQLAWKSKHTKLLTDKLKLKLFDGPFQKFILGVLSNNRDDESIVSPEHVDQQVTDIYTAGTSTPKSEILVFDILLKVSREQCHLISKAFVSKYSMTLHKAIRTMFAGSLARALVLWTSRVNESVSTLFFLTLNSPVVNMELICHLIARYSKSTFENIQMSYQETYDENLVTKLNQSLNGHFSQAATAWISGPCFDGGHDDQIIAFLESHQNSVQGIVSDSVAMETLLSTLAKQKQALEQCKEILIQQELAAASAKSSPSKPLGSSVSTGDMSSQEEKGSEDKLLTSGSASKLDSGKREENKESETESNIQLNQVTHRKDISYNEKFKLVSEYLLRIMKQHDYDDTGALQSEEFWITLQEINIGYTPEEIKAIKSWVDWDTNGKVAYDEVLIELSDSVISVIEQSGVTVEAKIAELNQIFDDICAKQWAEYEAWELQNNPTAETVAIPPDLFTYLKDTFDAFDVDQDGMLNDVEFWEVIVSTLGLHNPDMATMKSQWDHDSDGLISWDEAFYEFNNMFLTSVSESRDYWLGLVDRGSNQMYWYNLRDGNSFWMTAEEQERYQQNQSTRTEFVAPEVIPKLSIKTKSMKSNSDKFSDADFRKFKSEKKMKA